MRQAIREVAGTLTVIAIVAFFGWVAIGIAYGATTIISIDSFYEGDDGDLLYEGTAQAEPGDQCVAVLSSQNNESIHPDSDILVGPVVFADVESDDQPRTETKTFTARGPEDVYTRLGKHGVFSAGFTLEVTCTPPTTTTTSTSTAPPPSISSTTTITTPPATTTPTTESPVTTITVPTPTGVNAGGGSGDGSGWILAAAGVFAFLAVAALSFALILGGNGGKKD